MLDEIVFVVTARRVEVALSLKNHWLKFPGGYTQLPLFALTVIHDTHDYTTLYIGFLGFAFKFGVRYVSSNNSTNQNTEPPEEA